MHTLEFRPDKTIWSQKASAAPMRRLLTTSNLPTAALVSAGLSLVGGAHREAEACGIVGVVGKKGAAGPDVDARGFLLEGLMVRGPGVRQSALLPRPSAGQHFCVTLSLLLAYRGGSLVLAGIIAEGNGTVTLCLSCHLIF